MAVEGGGGRQSRFNSYHEQLIPVEAYPITRVSLSELSRLHRLIVSGL